MGRGKIALEPQECRPGTSAAATPNEPQEDFTSVLTPPQNIPGKHRDQVLSVAASSLWHVTHNVPTIWLHQPGILQPSFSRKSHDLQKILHHKLLHSLELYIYQKSWSRLEAGPKCLVASRVAFLSLSLSLSLSLLTCHHPARRSRLGGGWLNLPGILPTHPGEKQISGNITGFQGVSLCLFLA